MKSSGVLGNEEEQICYPKPALNGVLTRQILMKVGSMD